MTTEMMNRMEMNDTELEMVNGGDHIGSNSILGKCRKWLYEKLFETEKQEIYDPCNTCPEPESFEYLWKEDVVVTEGKPEELLLVM